MNDYEGLVEIDYPDITGIFGGEIKFLYFNVIAAAYGITYTVILLAYNKRRLCEKPADNLLRVSFVEMLFLP